MRSPHPVLTVLGSKAASVARLVAALAGAAALCGSAAAQRLDHADHAAGSCRILNTPGPDGIYIAALWPGGIIPYQFDPAVTPQNQQKALNAMASIEAVCNADFVPRNGEPDFVTIRNDTQDNAWVGKKFGEQFVGIWSWDAHFVIVHELIHCLGAWHEHQRAERDQFVIINWQNVPPDQFSQNQFTIKSGTTVGWYDFDSVMHYPRFGMSSNGYPTIEPRPGHERWRYRLGQTIHLSTGDLWLLTEMYGGPRPPGAFDLASPGNAAPVGAGWSPQFAWTAAQLADSYRLLVDDDPLFGSPAVDATITATSYAGGTLQDGKVYYWTVRAQNAQGATDPWFARIASFYTGTSVPAVLYADDSAPPGGDGASWATAFTDLQDALALAECAQGAPVEVRVGQGVYTPDRGSGDRGASYVLRSGLAVRGGFAGHGASNPDARDSTAYPTVLSGDLAGDDGPGFANNTENSLHVVWLAGQRAGPATLDGLTVAAGNADGAWPHTGLGGGLWADDCDIELIDCTFLGSAALRDGGGAFLSASDSRLEGCEFSGNRASPTYTGFGGGLAVDRAGGTIDIERCRFEGNQAGGGGGTFVRVSTASATESAWVNNAAIANRAGGGAWMLGGATLVASNCTFTGNSAASGGGAGVANAAQAAFRNCLFAGNTRTNPSASPGGGLWVGNGVGSAAYATLTNCTFSQNSSPGGPGGGALGVTTGSTVTGANCVFWGNTPNEIAVTGTSTAGLTSSNVQGGWPGTGNSPADPLLAGQGLHPFAPGPGSPCIDTGADAAVPAGITTDLAGNPRFIDDPCSPGIAPGPVVDRGAYEFRFYPDCTLDGVITIADFGCFQTGFVQGDPYADCNADGVLTIADFGCFQTRFVQGCP